MTTLERIEKIEQEVKTLAGVLGSLSGLQQNKELLTKMEDSINGQMQQIHNFNQIIVQRQMSLEQTLTSLAKTLSCTVDELESNSVISGQSVMTRIRKMDENSEKRRIEQMIQLQVIKESNTVTPESIVVVSQKVSDGSKEEVVSEYRVLELPSHLTPQEVKEALVGKSTGDVLESKDNSETLFTKIEKVFELSQSGSLNGEETENKVVG
jgi:hypothetical protein